MLLTYRSVSGLFRRHSCTIHVSAGMYLQNGSIDEFLCESAYTDDARGAVVLKEQKLLITGNK